MANPYRFGAPPEESQLSRTAKILGGMMQQDLTTKQAKLDAQRELEMKKYAHSSLNEYSQVMQDPNAPVEAKYNKASDIVSRLSAAGLYEPAKIIDNNFRTWAGIHQPKQVDTGLWVPKKRDAKGNAISVRHGNDLGYWAMRVVNGQPTGEEEFRQLGNIPADGGGGGGASTDEQLKAAKMLEDATLVANRAGADLTALGKGKYELKDDKGNIVKTLDMRDFDSEGNKVDDPAGKQKEIELKATLANAQQTINNIQGIMQPKAGWKITSGEKNIQAKDIRKTNFPTAKYSIKGKTYSFEQLQKMGYTQEQVEKYKAK